MWKYVGQRLKDSAEQTCSHIKNLRSTFSTCSAKAAIEDSSKKESLRRIDISSSIDGRSYHVWKCLHCYQGGRPNEPKTTSFDLDAPYLDVLQKCYQKKHKQKQNACNGNGLELNLLQWVCIQFNNTNEKKKMTIFMGIFEIFRRLEYYAVFTSVK